MRISVFGSGRLTEETTEYREARRLGTLVAERGHVLLTGGYAGLMEAASRGAHEKGGEVIGITMAPWTPRLRPNRYLTAEQAVSSLFERIQALTESDCLIALEGGAGTLSEVALAWNLRQMDLMPAKPVILVGPGWRDIIGYLRRHLVIDDQDVALLTMVDTVDEALDAADGADGLSKRQVAEVRAHPEA